MEYFKYFFNDILCEKRTKCGIEHVYIKLIDSWKCALDENYFVCSILIDLFKAFDFILHRLLIAKIKAYDQSNYAGEFMTCYLSDQYHKVKMNE